MRDQVHVSTLRKFVMTVAMLSPTVGGAQVPCLEKPPASIGFTLTPSGATESQNEAHQSKCDAQPSGPWTATHRWWGYNAFLGYPLPYGIYSGACYHEPTSAGTPPDTCTASDYPTCGDDDGSSVLGVTFLAAPFCGGEAVGQNVCGGGDDHWRCPVTFEVQSGVDQDDFNPILNGIGGGGDGGGSCPAGNRGSSGAGGGGGGAGNSVGNPIYPALAEKGQVETDIARGSDGLEFVRTYRSHLPNGERTEEVRQEMGRNWRHSWFRLVDVDHPMHSQRAFVSGVVKYVYVYRPDGRAILFRRSGSDWIAPEVSRDTLVDRMDGSTHDGWIFTEHHSGSVEIFDANGDIESLQLRTGRTLTWSRDYDGGGALESVTITTDEGRTLVMNYTDDRISSVVDATGATYEYSYDVDDNLESVTFPDATERVYHYNEDAHIDGDPVWPHALTGITDEDEVRFATFEYNSYGRPIATEHAGGVDRYEVSYSNPSSPAPAGTFRATVTDPLGTVRTFDSINILGIARYTGQSQPGGSGCSSSASDVNHDGDGNVTSRTDFNGNSTCYEYDTGRRLETIRIEGLAPSVGCPGDLEAHTPVNIQRKITTEWHPDHTLVARRAEPMRITTFVYQGEPDPSDNDDPADCVDGSPEVNGLPLAVLCKRIEQATTDPDGDDAFAATESGDPRITSWTYDDHGRMLTVNGPRIDVDDITTYTYRDADEGDCDTDPETCAYRAGDLWKVTNALEHVIEILAYDAVGRPISTEDANGVVTDMEYDARGRLDRRLVRGTNGASEVDDAITSFDYEPWGGISRVTQPDGVYLDYDYDDAHRLIKISDVAGEHIDYTLDDAGHRIAESTETSGNTVKRLLARQYDALGRMRSLVRMPYADDADLDDNSVNKTVYEYDANGNNDRTIDPLDVVTVSTFDALDRLIETIGDDGGIEATSGFEYDARDQLRKVTDPKSLDTDYTVDGLGNQTELDSPDTGVTDYVNDDAGNRIEQTDARSVTTEFAYDELNRLITISYPTSALDVTYAYDDDTGCPDAASSFAIGRLTNMTDASGSTLLCYDRRGNLVYKKAIVSGNTQETYWEYDLADRVSEMTYPSGVVVVYGRDSRGRIDEIDVTPVGGSPTALINAVTYLPFGPISQLTYGNSRTQSRAYDQNYWIDEIDGSAGDSFELDATLDDAGNITRFDGNGGAGNTYTYDNLYRLTGVDSLAPAALFDFTYDDTGNRLSKSVNGGSPVTYTIDSSSHQLESVGAAARSYDANGNTTAMNGDTLTYNDRNRLRSIDLGADDVFYTHNARGERVRKLLDPGSGPDETTLYAYNESGQLLMEKHTISGGATTTTEIIWLDNLPVGILRNNAIYYLEPDHLGTPRQVVHPGDNEAIWRWALVNDPFSESSPNTDLDADTTHFVFNLRFPGQIYDAETGLHYNYFRDYDPGIGRYVESDPIGLTSGMSTYTYVFSRPLVMLDPKGLEGIGCWTFNNCGAKSKPKDCGSKEPCEVYRCSAALGDPTRPAGWNEVEHWYSCSVIGKDVVCKGLVLSDWSGNSVLYPERFDPFLCKKVSSNCCYAECLRTQWNKGPKNYWLEPTCQGYDANVNSKCSDIP